MSEAGMGSDELYYLVDGKKQDAGLHEEMLSVGLNREAAELRVKEAVEAGMTEEAAREMFGLSDVGKGDSQDRDIDSESSLVKNVPDAVSSRVMFVFDERGAIIGFERTKGS
jgi:hypothetical protein